MRTLVLPAALAVAAALPACLTGERAVPDYGRYKPQDWARRILFKDGRIVQIRGHLYEDQQLKAYIESDQRPDAPHFRIKRSWDMKQVRRLMR